MQFGLSFLPDSSCETKLPEDYYREALLLCDIAEKGKLNFVKMTEHYLHAYGGYCPSPLTFLAAVASQTRHIRLMTGCILPVFHHPIQIAAQVAMLDAISGGRVDVGFARAYLPFEFDAFNISMDESRARYIETIQAVIKLWTEKNVTMQSQFFSFANATSLPGVTQLPHPPIWGAAVNSRQSFAWLGEQGFNLLVTPPGNLAHLKDLINIYRESYALSTGRESKSKIAISLPTCIAPTDKEANKLSNIYLQKFINVWSSAAEQWSSTTSTDYPGYKGLANLIRKNTPSVMRTNGQALIGSPTTVINNIMHIYEELGIDTILLQIEFGSQPYAVSKQTLELFIEQVMPKLSTYS